MRLSEFWQVQKRFKALFGLAVAVQWDPESLTRVLRESTDALSEIMNTFGKRHTADALDLMTGETSLIDLRPATLELLKESEHEPVVMRYALHEAGELVAGILNRERKPPQVFYDRRDQSFREQPNAQCVEEALYALFASSVAAYRFCANCRRLYLKTRPDKNTCSLRCAELIGKRDWARRARERRRSR